MASPAEITPANVMLVIHEKKCGGTVDFYHPFRQYIVSNYSEQEAQDLEDDFQTLRQMRFNVENPPDFLPELRCDLLQSYFRALCLVEPRFPISTDPALINSISFTWFDAFRPSKKATQPSLHLEKAAVLFNLGAVHSQVGFAADRALATGLKIACNSFQAAAGAYAFLKENVSVKAVHGSGGVTVDLSAECAGMLEKLMLAQSQECFFEKVMSDSKPSGLCSKIAMQQNQSDQKTDDPVREMDPLHFVRNGEDPGAHYRPWNHHLNHDFHKSEGRNRPHLILLLPGLEPVISRSHDNTSTGALWLPSRVGLYYEEAHNVLATPPLSTHFERAWISHVQLKAAQYHAEACYRYALELHDKENIAEEITRLKVGLSALSDAKKSSKGVSLPLLETVSKLESKMNFNLERAMKENDRVYLMRIPSSFSLSTLPAASLVKPTPMEDVIDASKDRLFMNLVPKSISKAQSRYTEMVDDLIRTQAEKIQKGSETTRVKLDGMGLPDYILALEGSLTLPLDLRVDVEAVQISGGLSGLEDEMQQLRDFRRVTSELMSQTEGLLQKEAVDDAQFRYRFGARWTRPQSSTLSKNLQDKLNRFVENLKQAADTDAGTEHALRAHSALIAILDHHPIEFVLPSLTRPTMSFDGNKEFVVESLKQNLFSPTLWFEVKRQVEVVGADMNRLEDMLKEMQRKETVEISVFSYGAAFPARLSPTYRVTTGHSPVHRPLTARHLPLLLLSPESRSRRKNDTPSCVLPAIFTILFPLHFYCSSSLLEVAVGLLASFDFITRDYFPSLVAHATTVLR
ncbi:hypothetical protein KSP40_PGU012994 [Platanthera guangdongensis]|uniref:BRO1 domain-containing protein n=1 Tax=Platanthera guangdongensis TaxID=2320717 RepID=A0ABR2MY98_9ASPA